MRCTSQIIHSNALAASHYCFTHVKCMPQIHICLVCMQLLPLHWHFFASQPQATPGSQHTTQSPPIPNTQNSKQQPHKYAGQVQLSPQQFCIWYFAIYVTCCLLVSVQLVVWLQVHLQGLLLKAGIPVHTTHHPSPLVPMTTTAHTATFFPIWFCSQLPFATFGETSCFLSLAIGFGFLHLVDDWL